LTDVFSEFIYERINVDLLVKI